MPLNFNGYNFRIIFFLLFFINFIIFFMSLIPLSFCVLLFALIGREAYRWSKKKMKNAIVTLQNRWKSVKSRYFAIWKVVRRYVSKMMDALFISSKKIMENTIRFILMWSLPVVFILSVVAIVHIRKEESLLV